MVISEGSPENNYCKHSKEKVFEVLKSSIGKFYFSNTDAFCLKKQIHTFILYTFYFYATWFWNNLSFEFHLITLQAQCVMVPSPVSWQRNAFSTAVHIPACLGRFSQVLWLLQFSDCVPEKQIKSSCFLLLFASFFQEHLILI